MSDNLSYDLHAHSTWSDGTLSPSELFSRASQAGINVFALTDHDTTAGHDDAQIAATELGITLIPGIEISVTWERRTIHILGLGIDQAYQPLQEGLQSLREFRDWRAEEIGRRLAESGIDGAYAGAKALAGSDLISRTHFARFLANNGYAKSVGAVFKRYLVVNKPGHVSGQWASLEDAVNWINGAGGQAVIAHPARYGLTRTKLLKLIADFKDCGGTGLEVVSGSHTKDECLTMAAHARTSGLLGSIGSDYHGPENPYRVLGRLPPLPNGVTPVWVDW